MGKRNSQRTAARNKKAAPGRALIERLRREGMLRAGERVAVGVSGGGDSVALLLLLLELRKELGIVLSLAHVNHQLRGAASDGDETFVRKLAATHKLDFYCERADVAAKGRREKMNLEDAARRARYEFFSKLAAEGKVYRVAVAHTADDQAETVLAHILRGTGLAGLGGIHPETKCIVRPLLGARRMELRAYLRARKQKWREDATNQDTKRMRARIRKKLLPLLEREFHAGVVEHLESLAQFAREDERFLDCIAAERIATLVEKEGERARIAIADLLAPCSRKDFKLEDGAAEERGKERNFEALTKRMVRRLIEERKRGTGQITARHVSAVLGLARNGESGKSLPLPGRVEVRREREELVFCTALNRERGAEGEARKRGKAKNFAAIEYEHKIDFRGEVEALRVPETGCVFRLRVIDWPAKRGETSELGAVLDRDRLRAPLVLRNWRFGDRLQPAGHQKARKLKRLLNEKRISRWEREGWPVLTCGGVLVWARGFPVAAGYAATEETRTGIWIAEEKS
ncbi:MAG: tRNA lysidine(34) synthetase TilS [Candidatus Acidiferrum sp.]